jgi:hypothetical protein
VRPIREIEVMGRKLRLEHILQYHCSNNMTTTFSSNKVPVANIDRTQDNHSNMEMWVVLQNL